MSGLEHALERDPTLDTALNAAKGAKPNAEIPLACRRGVGISALCERLPDGWRAKPNGRPRCTDDSPSQAGNCAGAFAEPGGRR